MKKTVILLLALVLAVSIAQPARAAEGLTVSHASDKAGQTVYLSVILNEAVVGKAMGITYQYDAECLALVPEESKWMPDCVLKDFDNKGNGVWATDEAVELKGHVCTIALRIKPDADFADTKVSVKLTVKDGSSVTGEFTAEALVFLVGAEETPGSVPGEGTVGPWIWIGAGVLLAAAAAGAWICWRKKKR